MVEYETFQSLVDIYNKAYIEEDKFEKGMEALLGSDSRVMFLKMTDPITEILKTIIVNETCADESDYDFFMEHLDDFLKGISSSISVYDKLDNIWHEYKIASIKDFWDYAMHQLPVHREYTNEQMEATKHNFHTIRFGENGLEIV